MRRVVIGIVALLVGAGCTTTTTGASAPRAAAHAGIGALARFSILRHANRPLDLAGPLSDGSLVLAAGGRLLTLSGPGGSQRFSAAYDRPGNAEPYLAAPARGHAGCSFNANTVYVLRLYGGRGVVSVARHGRVRSFARITAPGLINGIAFDESGGFGYRLLVTINDGLHTTVDAIDCHGRVTTITRTAPRVEGGIVVARPPFGRFDGDLIAPDEKSGRIYAITPSGRSLEVVSSGLSFGQDIGVESAVQIPSASRFFVLGADRRNPGNRHPGDDALLRIDSATLHRAGVRRFDLLVGTEGGARLVDVSCRARPCRAREVAAGPSAAHLEGHLAAQVPNPTR
ncbi:MAG: hypothetical protein ACR2GZ_03685 [Solirubrobacteraceae bacterium]